MNRAGSRVGNIRGYKWTKNCGFFNLIFYLRIAVNVSFPTRFNAEFTMI